MTKKLHGNSFSEVLLAWWERHGRKNLPWQQSRDPYPIWLAEIMLQQTQVKTVFAYYHRFLEEFPTLEHLAQTPSDNLMRLWSGLGYYARARNLQRAAQIILERHNGQFPREMDALVNLPGIGRSTAGAILAAAFGQQGVILDGNVRRVLSRYHAIAGAPNAAKTLNKLWAQAKRHTPKSSCRNYNQAIMDLGANVCVRRAPRCHQCPLHSGCKAHQQGTQARYPEAKAKRALPSKYVQMLLIECDDERVLLKKRAPQGIWGGLWSLPEIAANDEALSYCRETLGLSVQLAANLAPRQHRFSHFKLHIQPVHLRADRHAKRQAQNELKVADVDLWRWQKIQETAPIGLAAPIIALLKELRNPLK